MGRHVLELVDGDELLDWLREALLSGQEPRIEEGRNVLSLQREGQGRHYQFSITPVRGKADTMIGVVPLLRDITKLRELDRLKSDFIMTACHELRTPLTTVGMAVDLLLEGASDKLTGKQLELLAAAHEDLQRLRALVNDLLDLSRIEAGAVEMDFVPVPVRVLFENAATMLQAQAEEKQVELSVLPPDTVADFRANPNKATWVLTNLIAKALRYTPAGGHVELSAEQIGQQVHISVQDDGAGIPFELQPRIFDKFVQVGQVARRLFGVDRVIARVRDPGRSRAYAELGVETICPTSVAMEALWELLIRPAMDAGKPEP